MDDRLSEDVFNVLVVGVEWLPLVQLSIGLFVIEVLKNNTNTIKILYGLRFLLSKLCRFL